MQPTAAQHKRNARHNASPKARESECARERAVELNRELRGRARIDARVERQSRDRPHLRCVQSHNNQATVRARLPNRTISGGQVGGVQAAVGNTVKHRQECVLC